MEWKAAGLAGQLRLLFKCNTRGYVCFVQTPYNELQANCNLWRNWLDIQSSWQSLATIVEFWALASQKSQGFTEAAGPGSWNDPDMLIIGNEVGLTCPELQGMRSCDTCGRVLHCFHKSPACHTEMLLLCMWHVNLA